MTRIRDERKRRGWNQTDLAYFARVSQAEISRIESGKLKPSPGQLERLGRALGVRPDELAKENPA